MGVKKNSRQKKQHRQTLRGMKRYEFLVKNEWELSQLGKEVMDVDELYRRHFCNGFVPS